MGFDYFVFDTEHSPLNIYQTQTFMHAMRGDATSPIVRVWWNDIVAIKRALDIGAQGVLVPWINDKKAAELAVKATRYAPDGLRGCGPRRASLFDPEYLETADDEIIVICQIETREAVDNIEEIASVEGVDVTYIGPSDLSASFGKISLSAIAMAAVIALAFNKVVGVFAEFEQSMADFFRRYHSERSGSRAFPDHHAL